MRDVDIATELEQQSTHRREADAHFDRIRRQWGLAFAICATGDEAIDLARRAHLARRFQKRRTALFTEYPHMDEAEVNRRAADEIVTALCEDIARHDRDHRSKEPSPMDAAFNAAECNANAWFVARYGRPGTTVPTCGCRPGLLRTADTRGEPAGGRT